MPCAWVSLFLYMYNYLFIKLYTYCSFFRFFFFSFQRRGEACTYNSTEGLYFVQKFCNFATFEEKKI